MNIKKFTKSLLSHIGIYPSIKTSSIYDLYLKVFYPNNFERIQDQIDTLRSLIDSKISETLIFDIGANVGRRAMVFRKIARKVVVVEPDRECAEWLSSVFKSDCTVEVVQKAVGSSKGKKKMYVNTDNSALNTLSKKKKKSWRKLFRQRIRGRRNYFKRYDRKSWLS